MTKTRVLLAAFFAAALALFASPASANYAPDGVYGGVNGSLEVGSPITISFEAVGIDCDAWVVVEDETGEAPEEDGPGGPTFSFTIEVDEAGVYAITAECVGFEAAGSTNLVQPASYSAAAGETFDTVVFEVDAAGSDDDDDDDSSNGGGTTDGALPDTGGSNVSLLLVGGGLLAAGAGIVMVTRRRNA